VKFLAGYVRRSCSFDDESLRDEDFKALNLTLAGGELKLISINYCNDADLCNGAARLAEISTMKILLPASLVLLISFFSRL
jgi:hypothetical protein